MTLGYACCAVPGAYDSTGRDTFIINSNGTIFQSDRGPTDTGLLTIFNPWTPTWVPAD
jgi:hypothetical protein